MKINLLYVVFGGILFSCFCFSCTKDIGYNPLIAYSDKALYDSCRNEEAFQYYKNDPAAVYSGSNGPHGAFKLKFNKIAQTALTDNGKLPAGNSFPDGSMVVKEVQHNGMYALMYKRSGSWLWAEINSDGSVAYSVNKDGGAGCISCHSQGGHRDLVVSFNFY
ncbi:MAG: hypothetical protein K0R26_2347 [Bacteroidota bacterium]|jgi:hypothetical protein|nr:hypothetical protein [Bacteroidota bacterium]